jgi:hypothetical protein
MISTQLTPGQGLDPGLTTISGVDALIGAGITSRLVRAGKGDDPPRWTRSNNVRWQGYPFALSLF